MSERHTCHNPDKFVVALKEMFAAIDPERIRCQTGEVLQDMIEQLRQHEVSLKCSFLGLCVYGHRECIQPIHSPCVCEQRGE
jgi:hypothetical protein